MEKNHSSSDDLRRRAERALESAPRVRDQAPEDIPGLIHELEVHQIELEMQNEELRRTGRELELMRDTYVELYDYAPVGYLTIGEHGSILRANLTAADLIGVARGELEGKPLADFVAEECQDAYHLALRALFKHRQPQVFEVVLHRPDGGCVWVQLAAVGAGSEDGRPSARLTVTDIGESRRLERLIGQISQAERAEVRRDLHDTIGQELAGIVFLADRLSDEIGGDPAAATARSASIAGLAASAIDQVGQIARGLQPLDAGRGAFDCALDDLAAFIREVYGISCTSNVQSEVGLDDPEVSTQLHLIAREAAVNAAKHAGASRIDMTLATRGGTVELMVRDDGSGFNADGESISGMGIETMRARASLIGAALEIRGGEGGGTVVACRTPEKGRGNA